MDHDEYKILLENMRKWYKTIGQIFCPILGKFVTFNAKGFRHLRYSGNGKERLIEEQLLRFKLMPSAIRLIKDAHKIHEHRISTDRKTSFWALQGIYNGRHIRVILIGKTNGRVIYCSVMPADRQKDHYFK